MLVFIHHQMVAIIQNMVQPHTPSHNVLNSLSLLIVTSA